MYLAEDYLISNCNAVRLADTVAKTSAIIWPERGGMLISLKQENNEYIYTDWNNLCADERPRCAVPILFPSCGRLKDECFQWNGESYPMGIHGFAHTSAWSAQKGVDASGAWVRTTLTPTPETLACYPFRFEVVLDYRLSGNALLISQSYRNTDEQPMPYSFGFHPYFCISSLEHVKVDVTAKTKQMLGDTVSTPFTAGSLSLRTEEASDGILFAGATDQAVLVDAYMKRRVVVRFDENFPYLVLWSRDQLPFLCVEPWNGIPNGLNTGMCKMLQPGASKSALISIDLEE